MIGKIFVISGPSGVGKDTLMNDAIKTIPGLIRAISYTDRPKRADDKPDSYHFVSKKEFDRLLKTGEIFEWEYARDNVNRYGSSKKEVKRAFKKNSNIIKVVGPKSFSTFKKIFGPQATGIFIKYENLNELKPRIRKNRPDESEKEIDVRHKQALIDMGYEKDYDYSIVNPEGRPEIAAEKIKKIILEAKCETK